MVVADHAAFAAHLDVHLIQPDEWEHFRAWRASARRVEVWRSGTEFYVLFERNMRNLAGCQCPSYHQQNDWHTADHTHRMLADPETLRPYRRELLRLCPDFVKFPVWDDLAHPLRD